MRVRAAFAGTRLGASLTVIGCGAMIMLAPLTVTACAGGKPSARPSPSVPGASVPSTTHSSSASSGGSSSGPSGAKSKEPSTAGSHAAKQDHDHQHPASQPPAAAPATGGGGTAGLQDPLLFALGGGALLAGAGSLAYRARVLRKR